MKYLTLGSVLKDEESYMLDFVKYHKSVGVEAFFFLDRSYHGLNNMFKDDPAVTVMYFPEVPQHTHMLAWVVMIEALKGRTKWLACVDGDMALVPAEVDDVRLVLQDYEDVASLQCNWHSFGSSGLEHRNPGSLYERFLMRAKPGHPMSLHTSPICQPDLCPLVVSTDPHWLQVLPGQLRCGTQRNRVDHAFSIPADHSVLWMAHYLTKSLDEWKIKVARGRSDVIGQKMPMHNFYEYNLYLNRDKEERVFNLWKKANGHV